MVLLGLPGHPTNFNPTELQVKCVPNTELQLLDIRSPNISLIKTFSVRLQSDEWGRGNQSRDGPPPSPLFAFSSLISDDGKGSSTKAESTSKESYSFDLEFSPESQAGSTARSTSRSVDELPDNNRNVRSITQLSFSPPSFKSGLCFNVARYDGWGYLQRKRSATVACLTDPESESESEKEKTDQSSAPMESTARTTPVDSVPGSDVSVNDDKAKRRTKFSRPTVPAPWKPCFIPKRTTLTKETESKQTFSVPFSDDVFTPSIDKKKPNSSNVVPFVLESECTLGEKEEDDGDWLTTSSTEIEQDVVGEANSTSDNIESVLEAKNDPAAAADLDQREVISGELIPVNLDDGSLVSPLHDSTPLAAVKSASPMAPQNPGSGPKCRKSSLLDNSLERESICECEDCQFPTKDPELVLQGGILFVKNPDNVRPATYKFAITVSVALVDDKSRGWFDLVVPGLPRLKGDDCGYFLFQIPQNRGLEFRTTNLQRYKMVENCFFAEFTNSANFVVPIRVCDEGFYGIVRDFTVDQEIRADHDITTTAHGEHNDGQARLSVRYNALCSIRLHNCCFWAERCCFFLYLDGGPDGYFQCQLESQSAGLQIIRLETEQQRPIGVSHIKVICSPRDLEMFCVTWEINLPGTKAMNWLPRIYPVSSSFCESQRHYLRRTFTELEARSLYEEADDKEGKDHEGEAVEHERHGEGEVGNKGGTGEEENEYEQGHADEPYEPYEDVGTDCKSILSDDYPEDFDTTAHSLDCGLTRFGRLISWLETDEVEPEPLTISNIWKADYSQRENRKQAFLLGLGIVLILFSTVAFHHFPGGLFHYLQRDIDSTSSIIPANCSNLEGGNTTLSESNLLDPWCDFAQNGFKSTKGKNHEMFSPAELNVHTLETSKGDEDDFELHEDITGSEKENVNGVGIPEKGEKQLEGSTRGEDLKSTVASNTFLSFSLRDQIDYLLGWRGPV